MDMNNLTQKSHSEDTYQVLEKYGIDLVAEARAGKFNPVIGRDDRRSPKLWIY